MKSVLVWAAALCALAAVAAPARADFAIERFKRVPFVMAHRACWGPDVPENALRGIDLCIARGADMIEVDIHRTRDDVLVLVHDDTLDRTTTLTGRVDQKTHAELSQARLRMGEGGPAARAGNDRIPTLAEALRRIRGKAVLFLDMKINDARDRQDVLDLVVRENAQEYVAMYAFFPDDREAHARLPEWVRRHSIVPVVEQGFLNDRNPRWQPSLAVAEKKYADLQPLAFMMFVKTPQFLSGPRTTRIPLMAAPIYGLAGERDEGVQPRVEREDFIWGELLAAGATAFMTNHPLQLIDYAKRR